MISYKEWKLLNESLGSFTLGLTQKHNIGVVNNLTGEDLDEAGMKMRMPMYMDDEAPMGKPSKKPFGGPMSGMGDEEMGDEDMQLGDDEEAIGDDEEALGDDEEHLGHDEEEEGEDEDMPIDPDAELDDMDGEEGMPMDDEEGMGDEDDMGMGMMLKKKFPMGKPHMGGPFMNYQKKYQKKEHCGEDHDEEGKGKDMGKGKEIEFLQKKQKKFAKKMAAGDTQAKETTLGKPKPDGKANPKIGDGTSGGKPENQVYGKGKTHTAARFQKEKFEKKCSTGMDGAPKMCGKCKKQKSNMKETSGYERPQSYDASEEAFVKSLKDMYGNPGETFSDGMRDFSEDMLLPQAQPGPGEPGFAPQTRVGSDVGSMSENIEHLMKKIAELEKQLKDK